jgi:hypothetical protein
MGVQLECQRRRASIAGCVGLASNDGMLTVAQSGRLEGPVAVVISRYGGGD